MALALHREFLTCRVVSRGQQFQRGQPFPLAAAFSRVLADSLGLTRQNKFRPYRHVASKGSDSKGI